MSSLPVIDLSSWFVTDIKAELEEQGDHIVLSIIMTAKDIETKEPIKVIQRQTIPKYFLNDEKVINSFIESSILDILRHELQECLKINGKQVFNPHRK